MNLQHIRTFLAVAEHKSISNAARALHVSQPALSAQLNALEEKLGTQLFLRERGTRSVLLSHAGKEFMPLANQWLEIDRKTKDFHKKSNENTLRIGFSAGDHNNLFFHIVHKLMQLDPTLDLQPRCVERSQTIDALLHTDIDLVLTVAEIPENPYITSIPLFEEERYILCPANTILPDKLLSPEDLDPRFEISYTPMAETLIAWHDRHFPKDAAPCFTVGNLSLVHSYLKDPKHWTISPASGATVYSKNNPHILTYRKLYPEPARRICHLRYTKACSNQEALEKLLSCIREYVEETPYLHPIG